MGILPRYAIHACIVMVCLLIPGHPDITSPVFVLQDGLANSMLLAHRQLPVLDTTVMMFANYMIYALNLFRPLREPLQ